MYKSLKRFFFLIPAETSHNLALSSLAFAHKFGLLKLPKVENKAPVTVMGIEFPNKVGLAAGLDKNGEHIQALSGFGFGFIEVGTVTPLAQEGNPKPRLFRIPEKNAIINRMGFNNHGIDTLIENVGIAKKSGFNGVLGINIGKNLNTPVEEAINDYLICLRQAYYHADYITVNISSPNTPGLRKLQYGSHLDDLLSRLKDEQRALSLEFKRRVPLVVKVAPDLSDKEVASISKTLLDNNIDGVIASNTTLEKDSVSGVKHGGETGGLSGDPVKDLSTAVIAEFYKHLKGDIPIIGVGGISSAKDAKEKLEAGAELVQVYSGLIYQGPELVGEIVKELD